MKNNHQKKRKTIYVLFFILISLLIFTGYIYTQNEKITIESEIIARKALQPTPIKPLTFSVKISKQFPKEVSSSLDVKTQFFLFGLDKIKDSYVRNVSININPGEKNQYLSNGIFNNCLIYIDINPDNFSKLTSDELKFIILHEIAHCQFGVDKLISNISWDKSFDVSLISKIDELYKKQEQKFIQNVCIECSNKFENTTISSPAIIYHELMADGLAAMWWLQSENNEKFLEDLYEKRFMKFLENPKLNEHPTHFVLQEILQMHKDKNLSLSNVQKAAQTALIAYLQEMVFHYD